jgi:hypothetical protein
MSHKGSWSRVNDRTAYANNYDSIFRKKEPEEKQETALGSPCCGAEVELGEWWDNTIRCVACGKQVITKP